MKHGLSRTRLHYAWTDMKTRCLNPNATAYHLYGGRGIKVCDDWKHSFESFRDWALANGFDEKLTLDRIDVNGNYEPCNCRWISHKQQCRNRRSNVFYKGKTLAEWSEIYHISQGTLHARLKRGWSIEDAITTPVMGTHQISTNKENES